MTLSGLDADQRLFELYTSQGRSMTFHKGELVMGMSGTAFAFYIKEGYVRSYSINNRGDEYTHLIYGPDDTFPVYRTFKTSAQVFYEAITETKTYRLSRKVLNAMVPEDSAITFALLRRASRAADIYTRRIRNLEYRYASERIIYRLLQLCERFGNQQADGSCLVEVGISQQILATSINVSRESVNRTMEQLKHKGLIRYSSKWLLVTDVEALEKQLGTAMER